jgi:hypothetical protein
MGSTIAIARDVVGFGAGEVGGDADGEVYDSEGEEAPEEAEDEEGEE